MMTGEKTGARSHLQTVFFGLIHSGKVYFVACLNLVCLGSRCPITSKPGLLKKSHIGVAKNLLIRQNFVDLSSCQV